MKRRSFRADSNYRTELKGLDVRLPDGRLHGKITGAFDFGAGGVIEIQKQNGKVEMVPLKDEFVRLALDKSHLILQPFEFTEAKPE